MPPDKASFLFSVTDKIAQLTRELLSEPPPRQERLKEIRAQLRSLMLDYDHAETLWILAQPEPPSPAPPPPAPPVPAKSAARRFKSHPWYGRAAKPKGPA